MKRVALIAALNVIAITAAAKDRPDLAGSFLLAALLCNAIL